MVKLKKDKVATALKKNEPIIKKKKAKKQAEVEGEKVSTSQEAEIKYLRYSLSEKHANGRQLFLKKCLSSPNSLIVANIPAFLDINVVKSFLTQFVPSKIVGISNPRSSALNGSLELGQITLTFDLETEKAVELALRQCERVGPYQASDFGFEQPDSIVKKSGKKYSAMFLTESELQEKVDIFMEQHDQEVLEAKREARRKMTEPDEEGWITVTKASKRVAKAVKVKKAEVPLTGGLNKKKQELPLSFYSFEAKKSKLRKAQELQAKFEEDKKRLEQLKKARSFRPY